MASWKVGVAVGAVLLLAAGGAAYVLAKKPLPPPGPLASMQLSLNSTVGQHGLYLVATVVALDGVGTPVPGVDVLLLFGGQPVNSGVTGASGSIQLQFQTPTAGTFEVQAISTGAVRSNVVTVTIL